MLIQLNLDRQLYRVGLSKIFCKAGVLAELEEKRDALLYDIFAQIQAACKRQIERKRFLKILNRTMAVRTIQHNARLYLALRQWPWWTVYSRLRPMLAASEGNEELRRRERELTLMKERAQRDAQEREKLEHLERTLKSEQKKLAEKLTVTTSLITEKDAQIGRFMKHEEEREMAISEMEDQIDRLLQSEQQAHERSIALKKTVTALEEKLEHTQSISLTLQTETLATNEKLAKLNAELLEQNRQFDQVVREKEELCKEIRAHQRTHELHNEDLLRASKDLEDMKRSGEEAMKSVRREHETEQQRLLSHEREMGRQKIEELSKTVTDYRDMVSTKSDLAAELQTLLSKTQKERDHAVGQISDLGLRLTTASKDFETLKDERDRHLVSIRKAEEAGDQLRNLLETKSNAETLLNKATVLKEQELQRLRAEVSQSNNTLVSAKQEHGRELGKVKSEVLT